MEDYEHANAREWDLNRSNGRTRDPPEDSWQVVSKKPKVRPPPSQPSASKQSQYVDRQQKVQQPQAPSNASQKYGKQEKQQQPTTRPQPPPSRSTYRNQVQKSPQQARAPPKWPQQEMKQRNSRQPRPPPKLATGSDNSGERLWREREPPQAKIRIPFELASQDNGHLTIAKQLRTFIFPEGKPGGQTSTEFGVWGDPKAVEATLDDIRAWIEDWQSPRKSNRPAKFAKVVSLNPELRARAERKWEKEVKKYRFRQIPPPDKGFEEIGTFHWPMNEYKPEEILGPSYEALDPIRLDCRCYVVLDNKEQGLFRIMGRSDDVKIGRMRLRGTYLQVVARQMPSLELYLLHDTARARSSKGIMLKEYDRARIVSGEGSEESKTGYSPRTEDGDFKISIASERTICLAVISKLRKLHYYYGSLQMRIRLGTFLVTQFMRTPSGIYTSEEYKSMIKESAFRGEVTQELGDKSIEQAALGIFRAANDVLMPRDSTTQALNEVKPLYTAVFTFTDPTGAELGDIRLTIIWQEENDANSTLAAYTEVSKKWTRLDRDTGTPTSILDISLSEIHTGTAWQFEIQAAQTIEEGRLPTGFSEFGGSVRPESKTARTAANPSATEVSFVAYRSSFAHLKHIEQRLTYCYREAASDYTVELSRFQHRSFPARETRILSAMAEPTVYESRWGLSVHRIEWDTWFTKNERLVVGEMADWSHEQDVWFPPDRSLDNEKQSGFTQMMEKLKRIKALVMEVEEEDLMGGMPLG